MGNDLGPTPWRHQPSDRPHAPGSLRLVEAFLNTVNHERHDDSLATTDGLTAWCTEFGLDAGQISEEARARAVAVREALRRVVCSSAADPASGADLASLEEASRGGVAISLAAWPSTGLVAGAPGVASVLAVLVAVVHEARLSGTLLRLRVCGNDGCRWAFYDRSRNLTATWCSMTICGNRRKVRAYRGRKAAT